MQFSDAKFSEKVFLAKKFAAGILKYQDRLVGSRLDKDFAKEVDDLREHVSQLVRDRDDLREEMLKKTKEFNRQLDILVSKYQEGKKIIKIDFERSDWKLFGIKDKK